MRRRYIHLVIMGFLVFVSFSSVPAEAYVGPGAGFAFVSTFFVFLATFFLVLLTLLFWPVRFVYRLVTGRLRSRTNGIDRLIILGFDGMSPDLVSRWMSEGKLPSLSRVASKGSFAALRTTFPAVSPVAWSTFSTGVNPGKHNIYDFLSRNVKTYLPDLSSARIGVDHRTLKIGPFTIPFGKPDIRLLRKSRPFWTILGEHGYFSHILRVPITFPPEKFNGLSLSAMCVPDLQGTQGSFTYYTSESGTSKHTGGQRVQVDIVDGEVSSTLIGPSDTSRTPSGAMGIPFSLKLRDDGSGATLTLPDERLELETGTMTGWIKVTFRAGFMMNVHGICRFLLKEAGPQVKLYVTPLNIDPEQPALPVSHPLMYSVYLAKMLGPFATLGLAEDTWALNEGIISDEDFIAQCYDYHNEREKMFFHSLARTRHGVCACVFDTTDRMQHMFFRYLDEEHPALRGKDRSRHRNAIEDVYRDCDRIVGKTLEQMTERDVLIVMSDHGFKSFARGINLNSWLMNEGYLFLNEGHSQSGEWFSDVDWTRTRAFNLGLGGIYLNIDGRESRGIVSSADIAPLKRELIGKLEGLRDPGKNAVGITRVYDSAKIYTGPYLENAPDLIIGYADGYRASWDGVTGVVNETVFEDNVKSWSGDHCVDPEAVPGVFFCTKPINRDTPGIVDIAPTALSLFGLTPPKYMDGSSLISNGNQAAPQHRQQQASSAAGKRD